MMTVQVRLPLTFLIHCFEKNCIGGEHIFGHFAQGSNTKTVYRDNFWSILLVHLYSLLLADEFKAQGSITRYCIDLKHHNPDLSLHNLSIKCFVNYQ